jgi:hypothetical protein
MTLKQDEVIRQSPSVIKLAIKLVKYSAGGLTKEERLELFDDLLALLAKLAEDIAD